MTKKKLAERIKYCRKNHDMNSLKVICEECLLECVRELNFDAYKKGIETMLEALIKWVKEECTQEDMPYNWENKVREIVKEAREEAEKEAMK
jgi:hypothetical protein